ncbi:Prolyl endopeptidase, partial [Sesamum angolense]
MGSLPAFDEHLQYPTARRDESMVDNYHGVMVPDPYRWLEDPDSAETKEFVEKQMKLTDSVLKTCETRERLREKLTELYDFPKYSAPSRAGGKYFFFHNTGLQPQRVLYDSLDGKPEVLLDPNTLSEDGTVALTAYAVSEDAKFMAYGTSSSGSDWITIKVMRIEDKCIEPDTVSWSEDILCWSDPDNPKHTRSAKVTDDGKYVLLYTYENCDPVNKIYHCNISVLPRGLEGYKGTKELLPFVKLIDTFDALYQYIANDDAIFTFLTNKDAPRNKLVRVDLKEPTSWNELRDLETGALLHHLPLDIGTVTEISSRRKESIIFIGFTSFLIPGIIYMCNLEAKIPDMRIFREIDVRGFDRTEFNVNQVFVPSKDGTKIPMFIVARKGISLDGSHPCLLYGYGGFNVSITPYFSVTRILIAKHLGVIFCIANIRGGGEYGKNGIKPVPFQGSRIVLTTSYQLQSILSLLVTRNQESYVLKVEAMEGFSSGLVLIRDLIFSAVLLLMLVSWTCYGFTSLQLVRESHLFPFNGGFFCIKILFQPYSPSKPGHAWTSDFGCSDKEEEFHWLIKYSPLHNVRRPWDKPSRMFVQYPSTMLLTADHDDRVVPLHSLKLLACLVL